MKKVSFLLVLATSLFSLGLMSFSPPDEVLSVDIQASELKWTGYHLAKSYEHWGYVNIKSGTIATNGNRITSGEFVIDMNSINNKDVAAAEDNSKLVGHLKADDFFGVSQYPEAKLVIKNTEKKSGNTYATIADLTIKGITREIKFDTEISSINATQLEAVADLKIKRTDFNVMYGWSVENAVLDGEFRLQVKLVAKK